MALYSVYALPAPQPAGTLPVIVSDRFSWLAALLPPVHAIAHRHWLVLGAWVTAVIGLVALSPYIGDGAAFWCYVLLAALLGFEAPALRRAGLARRGYAPQGEVFAADADLALVDYLRHK